MNHPDHVHATVLGGLSFLWTLALTFASHIQQINGFMQFVLLCFSGYVTYAGWRKLRSNGGKTWPNGRGTPGL